MLVDADDEAAARQVLAEVEETPERGHPLGQLGRIEGQPLPDGRERDTDVPQRRDQRGLFELTTFVER